MHHENTGRLHGEVHLNVKRGHKNAKCVKKFSLPKVNKLLALNLDDLLGICIFLSLKYSKAIGNYGDDAHKRPVGEILSVE